MGIKKDLQNLIGLLTDDEIKVSKAITRVKSLNKKIQNKKLTDFIDGEVDEKYNDDTLPEYRLIWGEPTFEFKNIFNGRTDIRTIAIPEAKHFNNKSTNYRPVLISVSEIEEIIEKNKGSAFKILFTPGQFEIIGKYLSDILNENKDWQLTRAWWSHSLTSFPSMLFKIKQRLIDILLDIEHSILEKNYQEKIFSEKSQFDASFEITTLIEKAKNEIILIDGYIDSTTLKLLTSKNDNVKIKILTDPKAKSESLEVLVDKFNKQYKGLEVRYSKSFHDRFIVIDEINFYQIGASLKDLGNKTFSFIKLKEEFMTDALFKKFKLEWK